MPVKKVSDGEYGVVDMNTGQFYGNSSGVGTISGGTTVNDVFTVGATIPGSISPDSRVEVEIGGRQCSGVTVMSDTELTCHTPPGENLGKKDVRVSVITKDGTEDTTIVDGFEYALRLNSIYPKYGDPEGRQVIEIEGGVFSTPPDQYESVDGIIFDGSSWINTDTHQNGSTKSIINYRYQTQAATGHVGFFGSRTSTSINTNVIWQKIHNQTNARTDYGVSSSTNTDMAISNFTVGGIHTLVKENGVVKLTKPNGNTSTFGTSTSVLTGAPISMFLGSLSHGGSYGTNATVAYSSFVGTIFSAQICKDPAYIGDMLYKVDNDLCGVNRVLVRDFRPAQRDTDKVYGFYDMVSGVFFENDGFGVFTAEGTTATNELEVPLTLKVTLHTDANDVAGTECTDPYLVSGSTTRIRCTVPESPFKTNNGKGKVDVKVYANGVLATPGTADADDFYYGAPMVIDTITPNRGPIAGGQPVTIAGNNFFPGDDPESHRPGESIDDVVVMIGGYYDELNDDYVDGSACTIDRSNLLENYTNNTIKCTTTANSGGISDVYFFNGESRYVYGGSLDPITGEITSGYLYEDDLEYVDPNFGPSTGGDFVYIHGNNFITTIGVTTRVFFGDAPATNVRVIDRNTISVTTPSHAPGVVDILVSQDGYAASLKKTMEGAYEYTYSSEAGDLVPNRGYLRGGDIIILNGEGFDTATSAAVTFGGVPATDVVVLDETRIQAKTPPRVSTGVVDVTIQQYEEVEPIEKLAAFTYINPLTIFNITPTYGLLDGGTEISIVGESFVPIASTSAFTLSELEVTFGGVPCTVANAGDYQDRLIVCTTGAYPDPQGGLVDVTVTSAMTSAHNENHTATRPNGYTYTILPEVTNVSLSGRSDTPLAGNLEITFSMPMNSANRGAISLGVTGLNTTAGTWSDGDTVFTVPYSGLANATNYTVTIGDFSSATNNYNMLADSSHSFRTLNDIIPPTVTSFPLNGQDHASLEGMVVINFSERMSATVSGSVTLHNTSTSEDIVLLAAEGFWQSNTQYQIPYSGLDNNTTYSVTIAGFADAATTGVNVMVPSTSFSFTTILDTDQPVVQNFAPSGNEVGLTGAASNMVITFSKAIDPDTNTGVVTIAANGGESRDVTEFGNWNTTRTTFTIISGDLGLTYSTDYAVEISGFMDTADPANEMIPASYSFRTMADRVAPTVGVFTPTGTGVNTIGTLSVTFSEAMDATAPGVIKLNGVDVSGAGTWYDNNHRYELPYGMLDFSTPYSVIISGFRDVAGNVMLDNSNYNFTTKADDVKPLVQAFSPSGEEASLSGNLVVTFNEPMDILTEGVITLNGNQVLGAGTWSGDHLTYTLPYSGLIFNTQYKVTIAGFHDAASNEMLLNGNYSFTTLPDNEKPTVTNFTPNDLNTPVAGNLVVTFSEPMSSTISGTISLNDTPVSGIGSWSSDYLTYTLPYNNLSYGTQYNVTLSGFADLAENIILDDTTYSFSTISDQTPPTITLQGDNPLSWNLGTSYQDPGASALDDVDGVVSVNTDSSSVNVNLEGTYQVYFAATDSASNTGYTTRIVNIVDQVKPEVTNFTPTGTSVPVDTNIVITFDKEIGTPGMVKIGVGSQTQEQATQVTGLFNPTNTIYTIESSSLNLSYNSTYTVYIEGFADTATTPNVMDPDTYSFSTISDQTPPVITVEGSNPLYWEVYISPFQDDPVSVVDNTDPYVAVQSDTSGVDVNVVGTYYVYYAATDSASNSGYDSRQVIVRDTTKPTITSVTLDDTPAPLSGNITIVFSEPMNTSLSAVSLDGGSTFLSGSFSDTTTFVASYSNLSYGTNYTVTFSNFADTNGLTMEDDSTYNFDTLANPNIPTVISVSPSGANADLSGEIQIEFSKEMDASIAGQIALNGASLAGTGAWSAGNTIYIIAYANLNYQTIYTLTIDGFTDIDGNVMSTDVAHSFTTTSQSVTPTPHPTNSSSSNSESEICTAAKPSAPTLTGAYRTDSDQATLFWSVGNGSTTGWTIAYGVTNHGFEYGAVVSDSEARSTIINDLDQNTSYDFKIAQNNSCELSDYSNTLTVGLLTDEDSYTDFELASESSQVVEISTSAQIKDVISSDKDQDQSLFISITEATDASSAQSTFPMKQVIAGAASLLGIGVMGTLFFIWFFAGKIIIYPNNHTYYVYRLQQNSSNADYTPKLLYTNFNKPNKEKQVYRVKNGKYLVLDYKLSSTNPIPKNEIFTISQQKNEKVFKA